MGPHNSEVYPYHGTPRLFPEAVPTSGESSHSAQKAFFGKGEGRGKYREMDIVSYSSLVKMYRLVLCDSIEERDTTAGGKLPTHSLCNDKTPTAT